MYAYAVATVAICAAIVSGAVVKEENNNDMAVQYLQRYGYLNKTLNNIATNEDNRVFEHAINLFQEYYKLPVSGRLDNDTLEQMRKPRCGLRDILNFGTDKTKVKWPMRHLTWNFHLANKELLDTTQTAFNLWRANSSLTFVRDVKKPNILISWQSSRHMNVDPRNGQLCSSDLDGPGGTLAHAFYPTGSANVTSEIHVDIEEPWHIYLNEMPEDKYLLLHTLTHEIGHALGLRHNPSNTSIMYAFSPATYRPVELDYEDVINIQNLYGAKSTAATPRTTPAPPPAPAPRVPPELCALKRVNAILLLENRMYVAYGKHVWAIDIDGKAYDEPLLLSNYMRFIHSNYTRISAAYQTPSGHIMLFVDDKIYKVNYPDFTLVPTWPRTFADFGIPTTAKINGAVNTNKGRSYVLYNGYLVGEVNDCSDSVSKHYTMESIFPGIPRGITSVFRYLDGNLYFTAQRQYYKFNEFTKTVLSAGTFDLRIINVVCPRDDLLQQLRDLHRIVQTKDALTAHAEYDEDYSDQ